LTKFLAYLDTISKTKTGGTEEGQMEEAGGLYQAQTLSFFL
jgi:hypothetical protein